MLKSSKSIDRNGLTMVLYQPIIFAVISSSPIFRRIPHFFKEFSGQVGILLSSEIPHLILKQSKSGSISVSKKYLNKFKFLLSLSENLHCIIIGPILAEKNKWFNDKSEYFQ